MSKPYDILAKYYDYLQKDIDYTLWTKIVEQHYTKKDNPILEVGCGTGTLANLLHEKNYIVDAFDLSESMVKRAKEKYPQINFFVDNAISFEVEKKYYLIICFMDTVNYLVNETLLKKFVDNVYNALNFGGKIILDVHNQENLENFHGYLESGYIKDVEYRWFSFVENFDSKIVSHDFEFLSENKKYKETHYQLIETVSYYKSIFSEKLKCIEVKVTDYRTFLVLEKEFNA